MVGRFQLSLCSFSKCSSTTTTRHFYTLEGKIQEDGDFLWGIINLEKGKRKKKEKGSKAISVPAAPRVVFLLGGLDFFFFHREDAALSHNRFAKKEKKKVEKVWRCQTNVTRAS
jgi:hypothetical protein